jgi:4-hydroxy-2-oxoheptanedioate aldolase
MLNLKQALEGGEVVVGTWMNAPSASQVEIIGHAGFDFVILDTEHSSYEISAGENLIRAADAVGIPALMRVLESQPALIGKVLDYGAQGIVIPHVNTAADARRAVQGAHYAPLGARGAAPTVRATHYGHISWSAHLSRARSETLVVLQIEGKEGIENLDEIMAVDGVNVLFIGAFDLSESLGVSGQLTHPMLLDTIGGIVERAKAKDVALGIWMPEPEQVGLWVKQGVQVITVANNDMIFSEGCRVVVNKVQAQISEHSR